MEKIDLEEVKKQVIHDGILETLCLIKETREKIYTLLEDEDVTNVIKAETKLMHMTDSLSEFSCDLCDIMSVVFSANVDAAIDKIKYEALITRKLE